MSGLSTGLMIKAAHVAPFDAGRHRTRRYPLKPQQEKMAMSIPPFDPSQQAPLNTYYEINYQVALAWARLGIPVFPCKQDKTPHTTNGHRDATTDLRQIHLWWSAHPDAIPAISPGPAGLFITDLDRHDGKVDGVANFKALAAEFGQSARDFVPVHTAGGGVHLYFRNTAPVQLGCGRGRMFKGLGIDFRGDGGYVIAPGAVLADGRRWGTEAELAALYQLIVGNGLKIPPQWMLSGGAGTSATEAEPEACYDGPITPEMIEHAKHDVIDTAMELGQRGPRSNRGDASFALGLRIGFLTREGCLDFDWCQTELRLAMPDNPNAWDHCFRRGVERSVGAVQAAMQARVIDWEAGWQQMQASGRLKLKNPPKRNPMPRFEPKKSTMPRFEPAFFAGAPDPQLRSEAAAEAITDEVNGQMVSAACRMLAAAIKGVKKESKGQSIEQMEIFLASMVAAGMISSVGVAAWWDRTLQAHFNTGKVDPMRVSKAQEVKDWISEMEAGDRIWADQAVALIARTGFTPMGCEQAIRQSFLKRALSQDGEAGSDDEAALIDAAPDLWTLDNQGCAEAGASSNLEHFVVWHLGVQPMFDEFRRRIAFRSLSLRSTSLVTDHMLAQWNADTEAAIAGIYLLASDTKAPWAPAGYRPAHRDIGIWLPRLAAKHCFNSTSDQIAGWRAWDSVERIKDWLPRFAGYRPSDSDRDYVAAIGAHWIVNWARRLEHPGHPIHEVPVALSFQGAGKTSMWRVLADFVMPGSYIEGVRLDFDTTAGINRVAILTRGKTIVELAELKMEKPTDVERTKAILSATCDSGRDLYSNSSYDKPRQFAFVGTANCVPNGTTAPEIACELTQLKLANSPLLGTRIRELMEDVDLGFLHDDSGNRRFLPFKVLAYEIDLAGLKEEAPQLIAEALHFSRQKNFIGKISETLRIAAAQRENQYRETYGLEDRIRGALQPVWHMEHFKIRAHDLRVLVGIRDPFSKRREMSAALRKIGMNADRSGHDCLTYYFKGDKTQAQWVHFNPSKGAPTVEPPPARPNGRGFMEPQ